MASAAHPQHLLSGVVAMLVTPFNPDYSVNEERLRAEVDWAVAQGATGVVATPSIGEFLHLSEAERVRCFEVTLEQVRTHPGATAVAMTSGATTLEALHYARIAGRMGYDAQQLIAPYYWKAGEQEVHRHYAMVADAGDLPVVVYHNPALSKFHMSPRFLGELAALPGVVAIKEVETDLQHLEAMVDEIRGKADYLQTFRAYMTGRLLGSVGGMINIFAVPACVAIDQAWGAGDILRAQDIQQRLNRVFPRGGEGALGALGSTKVTATVVTGIDMGPARPPYMAPDDAAERVARRLPELTAALSLFARA